MVLILLLGVHFLLQIQKNGFQGSTTSTPSAGGESSSVERIVWAVFLMPGMVMSSC